MSKPTIMVQFAEQKWTQDALREACCLARQIDAQVVLVAMVASSHPSWLGSDLPYIHFSKNQTNDFERLQEMLEDYHVPYQTLVFQYISLVDALVQAAEHVKADYVFAHLPKSYLLFWQSFQEWMLKKSMKKAGINLILNLDDLPAIPKEDSSEAFKTREAFFTEF